MLFNRVKTWDNNCDEKKPGLNICFNGDACDISPLKTVFTKDYHPHLYVTVLKGRDISVQRKTEYLESLKD